MLTYEKFEEIFRDPHMVILDTNILLELYRQPAYISEDIIDILTQIVDDIWIPKQVHKEFYKNYQKICGDERKKYRKVSKELSDTIQKLSENIETKMNEYRKHNYTNIKELQADLNDKLDEAKSIVEKYEKEHEQEIQSNLAFLNEDKVKKFIDLLESKGKIGAGFSFIDNLDILQEGKIRFEYKLPPGYKDYEKNGTQKFGDLFVWKEILKVARKHGKQIIFVINDIKEDWWELDKNRQPVDLREELLSEFQEYTNQSNINFLPLDKFFSHASEALGIGKSKSSLQLSAKEDAVDLLEKEQILIRENIQEVINTIDVCSEIGEDFIEVVYKDPSMIINEVVVEKKDKIITYYIDLEGTVIGDLTYQEPGNYPYDAGKMVCIVRGKIEVEKEEYATIHKVNEKEFILDRIQKVELNDWNIVNSTCGESNGRDILRAVDALNKYKETIFCTNKDASYSGMIELLGTFGSFVKQNNVLSSVAELTTPMSELANIIKSVVPMNNLVQQQKVISSVINSSMPLNELAKQQQVLSGVVKSALPLGEIKAQCETVSSVSKTLGIINKLKP